MAERSVSDSSIQSSDASLGSQSKNGDVSFSVESSVSIMNQEYETQFFNFTPKSFSDGMYNAMLEFACDCADGARQYITTQFPDIVSEEEGNRASEIILPKLTGAIDKAFDKFESYILTNIFEIPKHVVLPEDQVHIGKDYTEDHEQQIDDDIKQLTEKIKCAKYMNAQMQIDLKELEELQRMYDNCLNLQIKTEKTCFDLGVSDLKEAVVFNNERAVRIQKIIQKLSSQKIVKRVANEPHDKTDYNDIHMKKPKIQM